MQLTKAYYFYLIQKDDKKIMTTYKQARETKAIAQKERFMEVIKMLSWEDKIDLLNFVNKINKNPRHKYLVRYQRGKVSQ